MKKIIGMGNALLDILIKLPNDDALKQFNLPKGSMQLVNAEFSNRILDGTRIFERNIANGGSAANTIDGLAKLGINTGFIGKICDDEYGNIFLNGLKNNQTQPFLFYSKTETGRAAALITPDSERTFGTYLGAAVELSPDDITSNMFIGYDLLHIEGYMVQNHDLLHKAVSLAKENGLQVSLDLASYNVVDENIDFLTQIVDNHVDIIFANEEEAKSFTGKDPEEALNIIAGMCSVAVVKIGKDGSLVKSGQHSYKEGAIEVTPVDTTGAGDLYAAGFLYGLAKDWTLEKCARTGALLAGNVIEVIGAKMQEEKWEMIFDLIKS